MGSGPLTNARSPTGRGSWQIRASRGGRWRSPPNIQDRIAPGQMPFSQLIDGRPQ
jgi:hypothetical protein